MGISDPRKAVAGGETPEISTLGESGQHDLHDPDDDITEVCCIANHRALQVRALGLED